MSVHSPSVPQTPTSTLPRPPRPPKPEHLSSAFTGTLNGAALREYIKAQKTGESASSFGSVRSSSSSSSRERERQGEGERDCESRYSVEGEGDRHGKGEGGDTYRPKSRSGKDANERTQISQLFGRGGAFAHERHDLGVDDIEGHSRYSTATSNATLRPVRGNANAIHAHAQQGSALIDSFRTAPETREWAEAARLSAVEHQHQQEQRDSRIGRTSRPVSAMSANEEFDDEDGGHERDESSATIKPSTYKRGSTPSVATAFGFTPNSNTPLKNAPTVAGAREPRSSVFSVAEAPEPSEVDGGGDGENETEGDISFDRETERSRAPSVLIHGEELAGFELHGHAHVQAQAQAHQHQHPSDRQEQERQRESFATTSTDHDQAGETQTHMQMPARPESIALDLDSEVHLDARTQMEGEGEGADEEADELQPLPLPPIASQGASSSSSTAATSNVQASHPHPHPHPQLQIPRGRPARALYDFIGEPAFNELSVLAGQCFEILNEELAGGWSLAVVRGGSAGGGMGGTGEVEVAEADRRGLVPRGWYCYIQDFTMSPPAARGVEPPPSPSPALNMSLSPDNHNLFPPTRYSIAADPNRTPTKAAVVLEPMTSVMGAPVPPLTTLAEVGAEGGAYGWAREDASLETGIIPAPPPPPGPGPGFGQSHAFPPGTLPSAYASFNAAGPSSTSSAQGLSNFAAAAGVYLPNEAGQTPSPSGYGTGWRASLFGGKTLNRFSTYVTSGAEDFVLTGAEGVQPPVPPHREKLRNVMGHRYSAGSDGVDGDEDGTAGEADRHYIVSGTAGPKWKSKAPPFYVRVHSPEKRTKMSGMQEYTVFSVTSTFPAEAGVGNTLNDDSNGDGDGDTLSWGLPYDPTRPPSSAGPQLTVLRRFSQFAWLAQVLSRRFPALVLPSLPEKQYSGRFANEFVETRRADLELWIGRVVRHPVVRYSEVLLFFLGCEDEMEWRRRSPSFQLSSADLALGGPTFFARVFHPEFNVDATDAAFEAASLEKHARAHEKAIAGPGGVMQNWKSMREGVAATSASYRELGFTILRMITGYGLGPNGTEGSMQHGSNTIKAGTAGYPHAFGAGAHGPPLGGLGKRGESGATNEQGAWCWREGCQECVSLTKALQCTAESLQVVADMYDDHARSELLRQHERLKAISRPHAQYAGLLETHRATLSKYREATGEPDPLGEDPSFEFPSGSSSAAAAMLAEAASAQAGMVAPEAERVAARCETVLNVTMAELDRTHEERVQDWTAMGRNYLDGQIEFYERVLDTLRSARTKFDDEEFSSLSQGPVLSSRYERELSNPARSIISPLPMPSAPVLPPGVGASAIRPVSLAADVISESVGSLLLRGPGSGSGSPAASMARHVSGTSEKGNPTAGRNSLFKLWG